jgi:hypothetical protein
MAQLYKMGSVLGHLDSTEFRIDTRVSTREIKKDYFNMIDSNLSLFYCSELRVNYHKIASNSVQRDYNTSGKIVDIDNNIKAIQIVAGNGRNGLLNKLMYVQSVLRHKNLDNISKKISKNIAELRKRISDSEPLEI